MKILFILFGVIEIFFLSGCTNLEVQEAEPQSKINVFHDKTINAGMQLIREPQLDTVNTVEIGENMYQKSYLLVFDTFSVDLQNKENEQISYTDTNDSLDSTNDLASAINDFADSITPGSYTQEDNIVSDNFQHLLYEWSNKKLKAICSFPSYTYGDDLVYDKCLLDTNASGFFTDIVMNNSNVIHKLNTPIKYKITQTPSRYVEDSFKYIVLYQGKIENQIKLSFREFHDNIARSAFTQDITYELDKKGETIVGFKGLRIKIIKATNVDITYQVIQDYR